MAITFSCGCGKTLQVKDEAAGRKVKCPACQAVATAPAAGPAFEVVEAEPPAAAPTPAKTPYRARPAATDDEDDDKPRRRDDDEDDDDRGKSRSRRRDEDDDDEDRPRKKRRRDDDDDDDEPPRKKGKRRKASRGVSGSTRVGYVIGGLIGIALGLVIAYFAYNSDSRRSTGRLIGGIVMAVAGGVSAIRGAVGAVPEDE